MEDTIFKVEESPKRTIKDVLYEEGRTQVWLMKKLSEYGIKRDPSQMSLYCNGKFKPKDDYILIAIAEIIGVEFDIINNCF